MAQKCMSVNTATFIRKTVSKVQGRERDEEEEGEVRFTKAEI